MYIQYAEYGPAVFVLCLGFLNGISLLAFHTMLHGPPESFKANQNPKVHQAEKHADVTLQNRSLKNHETT